MPNANKLTPRWWWWRREHEQSFWDERLAKNDECLEV